MSDKYNDRVREIAEKMAERKMGKAWNNTGPVYRRHQIDGFLPYARIAVKHMAEVVKNRVWADNNGLMSLAEQSLLEIYLEEQGLITDSAQEVIIEPAGSANRGSIHNPDNPEPELQYEADTPYCTQCGSEDMAYITKYANGEEWQCKECGHKGVIPKKEEHT